MTMVLSDDHIAISADSHTPRMGQSYNDANLLYLHSQGAARDVHIPHPHPQLVGAAAHRCVANIVLTRGSFHDDAVSGTSGFRGRELAGDERGGKGQLSTSRRGNDG